MSQNVVMVTCYLGRRKRGSSAGHDGEYTYEVWVVAEVRSEAAVATERPGDHPIDASSAERLGEQLREAVADVEASHVEGLIWKSDDIPEGQLDGFIAGLPDRLQTLADKQLGALARTAGMPAPAAPISGEVAGAMLLKPALKPVKSAVRGFEVAGAVIGVLTGAHGLAFTCVKHLVGDMLGALLSQMFSDATKAQRGQPAATFGPEAAGEVREAATESPESSTGPVLAYQAPAPPAEDSRQAQRSYGEGALIAGAGPGSWSAAEQPDNAGISELKATVAEDQSDSPAPLPDAVSDLDAI